MDLTTTLREHLHAFHHLGGAARVCLYDNCKAVVLRQDADGPLYNPKFLAFATHYGFQLWACTVRRPQTNALDCRTEAKYESDAELVQFRPGMETPCVQTTNQDGAPVVPVSYLRPVCEALVKGHSRQA